MYPAQALPADSCPLIHATADDMARTAATLEVGWGSFGDLRLSPGQPGSTACLTEAEARQAIFTQLATGLEALADTRLGRPLGTFDKPRPKLAEAGAVGRSLRNVTLSLQARRDLALRLRPENTPTFAAFDRALSLANGLKDLILARIAYPQDHLKVETRQQAVRAIRETAVAEMAPALGVTLGFTSVAGGWGCRPDASGRRGRTSGPDRSAGPAAEFDLPSCHLRRQHRSCHAMGG